MQGGLIHTVASCQKIHLVPSTAVVPTTLLQGYVGRGVQAKQLLSVPRNNLAPRMGIETTLMFTM